MNEIPLLFEGIKKITKDIFPELSQYVDEEEKRAIAALSGTVTKYFKEHFSKNDPAIISILVNTKPGNEKEKKLNDAYERVNNEACMKFDNDLSLYVNNIKQEIDRRLFIKEEELQEQINQNEDGRYAISTPG